MTEPTPQAGAFRPGWPARAGEPLVSRAWPLAAMAATLFACNVALQFPGLMNSDSVNQYAEAVSGRYTDWHPLRGRGVLFEEDLDRDDPWQFHNVRVS
jgi:homospermidine synthase